MKWMLTLVAAPQIVHGYTPTCVVATFMHSKSWHDAFSEALRQYGIGFHGGAAPYSGGSSDEWERATALEGIIYPEAVRSLVMKTPHRGRGPALQARVILSSDGLNFCDLKRFEVALRKRKTITNAIINNSLVHWATEDIGMGLFYALPKADPGSTKAYEEHTYRVEGLLEISGLIVAYVEITLQTASHLPLGESAPDPFMESPHPILS